MGSAFTTIGLDPIPASSDAVFVHSDVALYANAIDHKIMQWAADVAERDVLYAAAVAPLLVASPTAIWLKISGSGGSSVWKTVWADTGVLTAGLTNGTDFQVSGGYYRKLNENFVQFSVTAQRKNSIMTIGSTGDMGSDPIMFTFPAGYWPAVNHVCMVRGNNQDGCAQVNTSGNVRWMSGTPDATIEIDETCVVTGTFFTA